MKERTMPGFLTGRGWLGLIAVLIAGAMGACSHEQVSYPRAPDRIEPLTLRAGEGQLRAPVSLGKMSMQFQPPAGWSSLDRAAAQRIQRSVLFNSRRVRTTPLHTYGEQRTSSFLVVSHLRSMDADSTVQAIMEHTLAAHEPDFQRVDTLRQDGGWPIFDFVVASRDAVHHKVLVGPPGSEAIQFDYVVPRFQYPRIAPLIGASVASVQEQP